METENLTEQLPQVKPAKQSKLPTMYDLPSEDPEEPGLPDDFHYYQPQLLRETFCPPSYSVENVYVATDLNLYYDEHHTLWHKRPDWFAVLGASRWYQQRDLRLSYVVWDEGIVPSIVVELLSPGTEDEDLGQKGARSALQPPAKWDVYERILQIPYYVVFDRYIGILRIFKLTGGRYQNVPLMDNWAWLPEIELGLGVWIGEYAGLQGHWLRWSDKKRQWILTPVDRERQCTEQERQRAERLAERAEQEHQRAEQERQRAKQEHQRAEQERQRAERLAAQLRALGIEPE